MRLMPLDPSFCKSLKIFSVTISHSSTAVAVLFLLSRMLNAEGRSRWQSLRCAAGGGRSEQGLAQRSAFCRNKSKKGGNRKRKRDTAHDAVGSSRAGGAKLQLK